MPPLGPGIAPLTAIMFSSGSTLTTSMFWIVTCSAPMCPAPIFPLKIRDGSVPEPIDPACLWTGPPPCDVGVLPAPWRLITPAKPLPRDVPVTSTLYPSENTSAFNSSPTLNADVSSRRNSFRCFFAETPAFFIWPSSGFESLCSLIS